MDYMQAIFSWVNAPLFATMLLGMFVRWITPAGAFWGLLVGMSSSVILFFAVKYEWIGMNLITLSTTSSDMAANFWRAWWAWLICFASTVMISLHTKRKPEAELKDLVIDLTDKLTEARALSFLKKPEFYAIISLIIFIILNVYFW